MWKLFGYSPNSQPGESCQPEASQEVSLKELRHELEVKMRVLTTMFQESQCLFAEYLQAEKGEEALAGTVDNVVATLSGLNSVITSLKTQYEHVRECLQEHEKLKQMVDNHQEIVSALQDSHSKEVAALYHSKSQSQAHLQAKIDSLLKTNTQLQAELQTAQQLIQATEANVQEWKEEAMKLQGELKESRDRLTAMDQKYQAVVGYSGREEHRKVIDLDHLELEHIFYYSKLKHKILAFLSIRDLARLQTTSQFFYSSFKQQQSRHTFSVLKKEFSKLVSQEAKRAKEYSRIFELFPLESTKMNALKYLHFQIKPATYILPYLQEEQIEAHKKETEKAGKKEGRFSWRTFFADKREENKFSLANLKQEAEFQKVQSRIEAQFKNILQFRMPEDLRDFESTMEQQLRQLKTELAQLRGEGGQTEWSAQICCLSRYMYHQINELYNLLQVVFGELLNKNKQLLELRDSHEYLSENELVLRNLIENLAGDKTTLEKKLLVAESEVLRNKLEREAVSHNCQRVTAELETLHKHHRTLEEEHKGCKQVIAQYEAAARRVEDSMFGIREEIEALERGSVRSRQSSLGSGSGEDHC